MSESNECKVTPTSYSAQQADLQKAAQTNIASHKNPDVKPLGTPNASIKSA